MIDDDIFSSSVDDTAPGPSAVYRVEVLAKPIQANELEGAVVLARNSTGVAKPHQPPRRPLTLA